MERPCTGSYEYGTGQRAYHDSCTDNTVYYPYAPYIKTRTQFVDNVCNQQPPKHSTSKDGEIAQTLHEQGLFGQHEIKRSEKGQEKQYYQRVGKRYEETRNTVMQQIALVTANVPGILHRVCTECMHAENKHYYGTYQLHPIQGCRIVYEVIQEREAITGEQSIKNIAECSACTGHNTIDTAFV